jgi:hypothetical protein
VLSDLVTHRQPDGVRHDRHRRQLAPGHAGGQRQHPAAVPRRTAQRGRHQRRHRVRRPGLRLPRRGRGHGLARCPQRHQRAPERRPGRLRDLQLPPRSGDDRRPVPDRDQRRSLQRYGHGRIQRLPHAGGPGRTDRLLAPGRPVGLLVRAGRVGHGAARPLRGHVQQHRPQRGRTLRQPRRSRRDVQRHQLLGAAAGHGRTDQRPRQHRTVVQDQRRRDPVLLPVQSAGKLLVLLEPGPVRGHRRQAPRPVRRRQRLRRPAQLQRRRH